MSDETQEATYRWSFGTAEFDELRWELRVAGQPVSLEHKPLELLLQLLRHAGEVLTKDELLESVWTGRIVGEASLTNAIGKLRRALGDEAQTLVVSVSRVGYRLEGPVSRKAMANLPAASVLVPGDAVPRRPNFKLLERLAHNEDSEVWRAEQPKTHEIRIFKFSLDGTRLSALKREVTLARLMRDALGERADLVRMLDWDFERAPYFIEFESGGSPLDGWLEVQAEAIPRTQRLRLMAEIADVVASAHEVGVLHKDLKPANILVYGETGDWHPRLTDFGSGRLLETGRLEALGITQMGLTGTQSISSDSQTGTPLYLAPELAAGQSPSIKSDLYALGIILYQLLAGDFRRQLAPGWENDIDDALLRRDIADFANGDPGRRPVSARILAERLRTLDERRLRHDVEVAVQERIANSEAKLALARARRPWIAAALVLLAGGMAGSLFYAREAGQAGRLATAASQRAVAATAEATRNLARADGVNAFLVKDVIGAADPFKSGGAELSILDALGVAEKNILDRFKGEPDTQAQVRIMLAQAYSGRGKHALARDQYAKAVAVIERSPKADQSLALQARLHEAGSLLNLGDLAGFDTVLAPVLKAVDSDSTLDPKLGLQANFVAGQKAMLVGNMQAAVEPLEKANRLLASIEVPNPALVLRVKSVLGIAYGQAGQPAKAIALLRETSTQARRTYGATHPETLNARILLGMALNGDRRWSEAVAELTSVRRDAIATHGAASVQVLDADQLLATAQIGNGDAKSGLPLLESAYARRRKLSGDGNPMTLDLAAQMAEALLSDGQQARARETSGAALAAAEGNPETAASPVLQKLRFVHACAISRTDERLAARRLAEGLDPATLESAEPAGHWPQRIARLRRGLAGPKSSGSQADACPPAI